MACQLVYAKLDLSAGFIGFADYTRSYMRPALRGWGMVAGVLRRSDFWNG